MRKLIVKILLILTILPAYGQINTEVPFKILKGHQFKVMYLRFSSDGKYLASCGWDNTVRIWDMEDFSEVKVLKGHTDNVWVVDISKDNRFVLSGSMDASFILWNLNTGELIHKVNILPEKVKIYPQIPKESPEWPNSIFGAAFDNKTKIIAIGSSDRLIRIYDIESLKLLHTLKGHENEVYDIIFSADNNFMVSGAFNKELIIWDTKTFKPIKTIKEEQGYNGSFQLINSDKWLINTGNCKINVWDISSGEIIRSIPVQCSLQSVQITPDEKYIATCAEDHSIKLWDFKTGKELWCYINQKPEVADCKISPNGKYLAVATPESNILIWKISELVKNK